MPNKKYIVSLTQEEQESLEKIVSTGKHPAYKVNHARILLLANQNREDRAWKDEEISQALNISHSTVERTRKKLVEEGLEACLKRQEQKKRKAPKLDGEKEAHLIALACSEAPEGRSQWTLRLLAERMVELGYVESISYETVRQTLKKTHYNRIKWNLG